MIKPVLREECLLISLGSMNGWVLWSECLCPYPQVHVEILILKVIVFGGGVFGPCLGHGVLMNAMSALIQETPERSVAPPTV